ncbi:BAR domain protein [Talaromyces stipitatus ATCC 10500]|uniref:BAR domain protein n=1 Tax=Talaromyces stipitatus (strain ATCC 10500 / CBS 375.48 / QM 6759 / NRRL 1006) TaxID=441959 RepID=B8MRA2_TALSN|nr:BAR domain protein [Talaromyces stipitatus ATCC 10500]EED12997.1 BAR domain protein [Talaromyces stipitatus ATCC 10500]
MNVNKKLDRFKQWAGERMGGEVKTNVSDDFKALETEMNLRHDGMEKMHRSMTAYVKAISKRKEGDDKEKTLPIAHLGSVMIQHGEDFDSQSEFGRSLTLTGKAHERLARIQESYSVQASTSWLEALERSLASLKEYQNARKKLESRRLAYDASLAKMQKAKKEDFRVEEELRSQKAKYEETNDDVYRRMMDIQDAEGENLADLTAFIDAELNYHERSREVLLQLRNELPTANPPASHANSHRPSRARSNTAHSYQERYEPVVEVAPPSPPRPTIRSRRSSTFYPQNDETPQARPEYSRPAFNRVSTYDGSTHESPSTYTPNRVHNDLSIRSARTNLRPVSKIHEDYQDSSSYGNVSPYDDRSESSATSQGGYFSRTPSSSALNSVSPATKKGPPPPPPSRATKPKPPPPPPPVKRNLIGA